MNYEEMSVAQSLAANFLAEYKGKEALSAANQMLRSQTEMAQIEFWREVIFNITLLIESEKEKA